MARGPVGGDGTSVRGAGPEGTRVRGKAGEKGGPAPAGRAPRSAAPRSSPAQGKRAPVAREGHGRELIALFCLGLAIFLTFVLVAGGEGGLLGEAARKALATVLGRLAFLVPLGFLLAAAVFVFDLRLGLFLPWVFGAALVLLAFLLLVSAGFPPLGAPHGAELFVAEDYRARAGWAGEVFYAGGHKLAGMAGVGIAGWLSLLAGFSLLTGLTVRRILESTGRAATGVRRRAEELTRTGRPGRAEEAGGALDPYLSGFGPPPTEEELALAAGRTPAFVDATSEAWPEEDEYGTSPNREPEQFREDPTVRSPAWPAELHLVDGPADFPDLYDEEGRPLARDSDPGRLPRQTDPAEQEAGSRSALVPGQRSKAGEATPPDDGSSERWPEEREKIGAGRAVDAALELFPSGPPYQLPNADLLHKSIVDERGEVGGDRDTAALLVETLSHFGVEARVGGMVTGPRVTRYELQLAPGTKVSKVAGLKDDLAYALASTEIRILAPIPGKSAVGVEVPNRRPSFVTLGDIYRDFPRSAGPLMVWLGKDISGKAIYTDLAKLPHLLIAGTTGSGKSGCVNCIISSILLRARPDQVRLILIDPKKVELSHYERIPHLLVPVVTNMKNAAGVLANVVKEMDNRYELMELEKARHLDEMNKSRRRRGEAELPYVVVVIDELADLMMVSPADVEEYIIRVAQKARAVGIHLVVATQRPSVDVITGMIKANIPSRIAFAVSSQTDSRVILDQNGAEALLGQGDMLFKPLGSSRLQRVQGAYITEEEIQLLVTHARLQKEPEFREELLAPPVPDEADGDEVFDPDEDDLLADAAEMVLDTGSASVSMLQRRLRVGYTRAGRLIDMLERRGIVGPYEGSKPRQILVRNEERERMLDGLRPDERASEGLFDDEV